MVRHMDLMSAMFAKTGAAGNELAFASENTLKQAILRCQSCGAERECKNFLDTARQDAAPPPFCRNASLIASMREQALAAD